MRGCSEEECTSMEWLFRLRILNILFVLKASRGMSSTLGT